MLEVALPSAIGIEIREQTTTSRITSQSTPLGRKTKRDLKGKSVLHICSKLFNMLFGSNAHSIMLLNFLCFVKMLVVILSVFIAEYV